MRAFIGLLFPAGKHGSCGTRLEGRFLLMGRLARLHVNLWAHASDIAKGNCDLKYVRRPPFFGEGRLAASAFREFRDGLRLGKLAQYVQVRVSMTF